MKISELNEGEKRGSTGRAASKLKDGKIHSSGKGYYTNYRVQAANLPRSLDMDKAVLRHPG